MNSLQLQIGYAGAALLCAVVGSVCDIRSRKIPNMLTGPAIAVGIVLHGVTSGWRGVGDSALAGTAAGALFLLFYLAGGMGAGDVKLMAAIGCLEGFSGLLPVLIATSISGGIFAVFLSVRHGRLGETLRNVGVLVDHHRRKGLTPNEHINVMSNETLKLPFALPIAGGCVMVLFALLWGGRL